MEHAASAGNFAKAKRRTSARPGNAPAPLELGHAIVDQAGHQDAARTCARTRPQHKRDTKVRISGRNPVSAHPHLVIVVAVEAVTNSTQLGRTYGGQWAGRLRS